jgi:predicted CopG family antitoxin
MNRNDITNMAEGRKTISINDDTYYALAKLGDLSETFDEVIKRLVKEHIDREKELRSKK